MRIILIGAPGAGKGTQAQFITSKYDIPQISSGNLLREVIKSNSNLGKQVSEDINTGKLVNDDIIIKLIKERILQRDCLNGFLLDGFPRTIAQASAMKKLGIVIDYVLELNVSDELIIDRLTNRRIHANSGRIYNIKFNPPKLEGKDDLTGESLVTRKDDIKETILNRLSEYHKITAPLINFYKREAQINNIYYFKINGNKVLSEVYEEIKKIFN